MPFTHVHAHSHYSVSDGMFTPKQWVKALVERGFIAHALTDHGSMSGLLPFYHAMREAKLVPLMGMEAYFCDEPTIHDADHRSASHLVLIAKNYEGWQNLLALTKLSYTDGFYYRPRIGPEWLEKHSAGLIASSACIGGVLAKEIWLERDGKKSIGLAARYKQMLDIFGADFYVEFQGHQVTLQREINDELYKRLAGCKPVVTNDCHYILPEHSTAQILLKQSTMGRSERADSAADFTSLYLASPVEIFRWFAEYHNLPREFVAEGMRNTQEIVEKCRGFELPVRRYLPKFKTEATVRSSAQLFKDLCLYRLRDFLKDERIYKFGTREDYIARFKREFDVITRHKLQDYFLIVWDILSFARNEGIYVGIGRGSSAGSLICRLLDITKINPLQFDLLFERFLNDDRCSTGELPDIDLDFESVRRDEVKQYVFDKYGTEYVCEIGTYGTMQLKTATIDFGKQFGIDHRDLLAITTKLDDKELAAVEKLAKEGEKSKALVQHACDSDPRLARLMKKYPDYRSAVETVIGQIKSQSVHPAGVVISSEPLETVTPIKSQKKAKIKERVLVTQSEDEEIIRQGLVKIDILGIKEYDIFKSVIVNAKPEGLTAQNYIEEILSREFAEPNKKVWKMFRTGDTDGVFQFASSPMKSLLREMKPATLDHIIAAVALYRPGPMENGWHLSYCARRAGDEPITYMHEALKDVLKPTYGIPVYQEQVMAICNVLGDIPLVMADTIRSALGKKNEEKLKKFGAMFVKGAGPKVGESAAQSIWDSLVKFAGYSFNKSHSAVYGAVAYISQWFKVHYPTHFWAAVLDWDCAKGSDDLIAHKKSAARQGVTFAMPDINESRSHFVVREGKTGSAVVVWPFTGVRGIGAKTAQEIERCQPYKGFDDFRSKVNRSKVRANNVLALVYAGAFDRYGDRNELASLLLSEKKDSDGNPGSLLFRFYETMGFFDQRLRVTFSDISESVFDQDTLEDTIEGEPVLVAGMITEVSRFKTKKGDPMGALTLVDADDTFRVTLFNREFMKHRDKLKVGNIIQVGGRKSMYGGVHRVEAESVKLIFSPTA